MNLYDFEWPSDLRLEIEPDQYPGEVFVFVSENYRKKPDDASKIIFRARETCLCRFFDNEQGWLRSTFYRIKKEFGDVEIWKTHLDFLNKQLDLGKKWRWWTQQEISDKWSDNRLFKALDFQGWTDEQKIVYEKTRRVVLWLIGQSGNIPLLPGSSSIRTRTIAWSIAASIADSTVAN